MTVIAVINQKGGVGKTATSCNLSYALAKKDHRTLLIDLDPSANASHIYAPHYAGLNVKDFLLAKDILMSCVAGAVQDNGLTGLSIRDLSIIPSNISLALTDKELGNKSFRESLLAKKLHSSISFNFEYILIDCPPNLGTLTINAMYAADFILIPVTYEKDALEGVADLFNVLSEIKEGHTYDLRIIRNRYDARRKTANNFVSEKLQSFIEQGVVLDTIIRQDEEVNKATIENQCVLTYCPKSNAAQDYINLATELEGLLKHG